MKVLHIISGGFFVDGRQYRTGDYVQEDEAAYPELAARVYPDTVLTKDTRVLELDTESEDYPEVVLTLPKYLSMRQGQLVTSGKKGESIVKYTDNVKLVAAGGGVEIYGPKGIRSGNGETVEMTVSKVTLAQDKVVELAKASDAPDLADTIKLMGDKAASAEVATITDKVAVLDVPETAKRGRRKS